LPRQPEPDYSSSEFTYIPNPVASSVEHPSVPQGTDTAVAAWLRSHGWRVTPARWEVEPELGFYVWQEEAPSNGRSHALWISEPMVRRLTPDELAAVLNREGVAEDIRINFKVRIEERGAEYRVSVVPRKSGEFRKQE
jgi:hypothetical protein